MKKLLALSATVGLLLLGSAPLLAQTFTMVPFSNPSCMQAAIRERDDGFISAFNAFNQSVTAALQTRKSAEVEAWNLSDPFARNSAMINAEASFTASYNAASRDLEQRKQAVRLQYQASSRACWQSTPPPPASSASSSARSCTPVYCILGVPDGCFRGSPTMVNGCAIDCGRLICPNSSSSSAQSCYRFECGPAIGMPNWLCPDGSIGGPSCERQSNGRCGYVIRQCPAPSSSSSSAASSVACSNLSGLLAGQFTVPGTFSNAGRTITLSGAGSLNTTGFVQVSGLIHTPGFVYAGQATGTLTLSNSQGSITLALTGSAQGGFAPPSSFSYVVQSSTGQYAGATGQGSVNLQLMSSGAYGSGTFQMTVQSGC